MTLCKTLALALGFASSGATALADEVTLVPGTTVKQAISGKVRGSIQSESPAEVVVKVGANNVNIPVDQIVAVRYDNQPASMALAESNETGGQLAKAAELYKKAVGEASGKALVEQAAQYKLAEVTADLALADPSRSAEAVSLLDAFTKAHPSSRLVSSALETLARLQLQKGDYPQAEATIASLAKLPAGPDRAAVLKARVAARKGDHDAALADLDRIIKAAPEKSPRKHQAQLARAESLAALKKFPDAEAAARAVITALPAEDAAAQSAAYNTLGDCLRAAGRPKDALLAYLHTDVLYAKDKEQHPRALAHIAQLWRELKRDDRADEAMQRLRQDYPQSPWLSANKPTP